MRGRATAVIVAALAMVGAAGAGATLPQLPDEDPFLCWKDIRPCGEPIELGRHRWFNGPMVVTAYSSGVGPCIDYASRDGGFGSCGPIDVPEAIDDVILAGRARSRGHAGSTEVAGFLAPEVAGVRVRYRTEGRTRTLPAFTAQVDGRQQRKLEAKRAFGVFEVTLRGCIPGSHIRLRAFAADGSRLGTDRSFGKRCFLKDAKPGSGGIATEVPDRTAYRLPPR